ncbi:MAG: type II toxin-antitoxin system RelE/ParE family toxin [Oscillospiraceae bacterium]|nr:type II toxin-antitoxin system RelE/ParE family toxin [Oscillospiraceae bacterium]
MKPVILKSARDDLKAIHEYLTGFGENPPEKFRKSFEKFCIQVTDMPNMFSRYEHDRNYRKAVIAFDYLVFYKTEDTGGGVRIYRILHGKRNIEPLMQM